MPLERDQRDPSRPRRIRPLEATARTYGRLLRSRRRWIAGVVAALTLASVGLLAAPPHAIPDGPVESVSEYERLASECLVIVRSTALGEPDTFERIEELAEDLSESPWVETVLWAGSLVGGAPPGSILEHPFLRGRLVNDDATALLLLLAPSAAARSHYTDFVSDLERILAAPRYAGRLDLGLTGRYPIQATMATTIQSERIAFQLVAYVLAFVLGALIFGSAWAMLVAGLSPALGVLWTLSVVRVTPASGNAFVATVLPVTVMMIGFTEAVHLMMHVQRATKEGARPREAAASAVEALLPACALTSLTTAIAMLSLCASSDRMVRDFGIASAIGIGLTFLSVNLLLPVLTSLRAVPVRQAERPRAAPALDRAFALLRREHRLVSGVGLGLMLASLAAATGLWLDERPSSNLPAESGRLRSLQTIDREFGGHQVVRVAVTPAPALSAADEKRLLREVQGAVESAPRIARATSLADVAAALRLLPPLPQALATAPLTSAPANADATDLLVFARVPEAGTRAQAESFQHIERALSDLAARYPGTRFELGGSAVEHTRRTQRIARDLVRGLLLAAGSVCVALVAACGSVRLGLTAMLPNLFPIVATAAGLRLFGLSVSVTMICAFTIALGIAADDTIHFLVRYRRELAVRATPGLALARTFRIVSVPILVTTAVMITGLAIVLTSEVRAHRVFGGMTCTALLAALIGDLVLLPALLTFASRRKEARTEQRGRPMDLSRGGSPSSFERARDPSRARPRATPARPPAPPRGSAPARWHARCQRDPHGEHGAVQDVDRAP